MEKTQIKYIEEKDIGKKLIISGWIQQYRIQSNICFLCVNDGSNVNGIQIVYNKQNNSLDNIDNIISELNNGCYIVVSGELIKSPAKGQTFELKLLEILVFPITGPKGLIFFIFICYYTI